jgi:hypothetical protein
MYVQLRSTIVPEGEPANVGKTDAYHDRDIIAAITFFLLPG